MIQVIQVSRYQWTRRMMCIEFVKDALKSHHSHSAQSLAISGLWNNWRQESLLCELDLQWTLGSHERKQLNSAGRSTTWFRKTLTAQCWTSFPTCTGRTVYLFCQSNIRSSHHLFTVKLGCDSDKLKLKCRLVPHGNSDSEKYDIRSYHATLIVTVAS